MVEIKNEGSKYNGMMDIDIAFYRQNGYLCIPEFYSSAIVKTMQEEIERVVYLFPEKVHFEVSELGQDSAIPHKIYNFIELSPLFTNISNEPRLMNVVNELTGWDCTLCTDKINLKQPGGRAFYPHQDMSGMWSKYMSNIISVFVAIDEADASNGCLQVAPMQHLNGLLGEYMQPMSEDQLAKMHFADIRQRPGDVLFFDGYLPHRSAANHSDKSRRTLLLSFNNKEEGDFRKLFTSGM